MNILIERPEKIVNESVGTEARLSRLAQKAKRLKGRGKKLPKGFQLEPINPEKVGMAEDASDAYTPEQLVALFAHPRKTVDWDNLDTLREISYFYEGE